MATCYPPDLYKQQTMLQRNIDCRSKDRRQFRVQCSKEGLNSLSPTSPRREASLNKLASKVSLEAFFCSRGARRDFDCAQAPLRPPGWAYLASLGRPLALPGPMDPVTEPGQHPSRTLSPAGSAPAANETAPASLDERSEDPGPHARKPSPEGGAALERIIKCHHARPHRRASRHPAAKFFFAGASFFPGLK